MLADTIEKSMGVKNISIFLQEAEQEGFRPALIRGSGEQERLKAERIRAFNFSSRRRKPFFGRNWQHLPTSAGGEELSKIMVRFKAEVCLPLIYMNRLIGFINLGP